MKALVNIIRGLPLIAKIIILCLYPIGTVAMIIYLFADNILNRSAMEQAVWNNPTEETVKTYAEYLKSKHFILNNNNPSYWNRKRELWQHVNRSKAVTSETKALFLEAMKKSGVHINNAGIKNNFYQNTAHDHMQEELNRQFTEQSMEEARKAVTPFDHGGYMQGDGFNPSDTIAADAQRQMENMNRMNDMNNMNNINML